MKINDIAKYAAAMVIAIAAVSCNDADNSLPADTLVRVGKSTLTRTDLDKEMPAGLTYDDSVKYARAYIKSWIDTKVISQLASKEIDMQDIDLMVEQYRNELIMWEYTRQMFDSHAPEIPEDSIKAYYEKYKQDFVLTRPMVKGVYLKVADNSPSLPTLRKLYRSNKSQDVDNLDKSELNGAVHYDYFRDNWIDWEQIESRIPYEFGQSSDNFLRQHSNLDFSQGGFTYLLDINDVLHTGQVMPYDAARSQIIDRLNFRNRKTYDSQLRQDLYEKGLKNGKISIFYDTEQ